MNASILMACIPFLKVLMEHLQQGWTTSDVRRGVGFTVAYGKTVTSSSRFPSGSVLAQDIKVPSSTGSPEVNEGEVHKGPVNGSTELDFITNATADMGTNLSEGQS